MHIKSRSLNTTSFSSSATRHFIASISGLPSLVKKKIQFNHCILQSCIYYTLYFYYTFVSNSHHLCLLSVDGNKVYEKMI